MFCPHRCRSVGDTLVFANDSSIHNCFPRIVVACDIELGSNSELRFPRANKRVDVRSQNRDRKYRCRDYFWYSQAQPICALGWKQDCIQSNQYLTRELFSFLEFPMHMGGRSTNRCEEGRQTNKQRWIGWMKARATPLCYIHPTSSEQSNTISSILYSKFTIHALYSILHTLVSDLHLPATPVSDTRS